MNIAGIPCSVSSSGIIGDPGFIPDLFNHIKKQEKGLIDKEYRSILAGVYHLLGEIEVVFGLWGIILAIAITYYYDWQTFAHYVDNLHYREPLFILVIMTIASSRPIVKFFELLAWKFVNNINDGS